MNTETVRAACPLTTFQPSVFFCVVAMDHDTTYTIGTINNLLGAEEKTADKTAYIYIPPQPEYQAEALRRSRPVHPSSAEPQLYSLRLGRLHNVAISPPSIYITPPTPAGTIAKGSHRR